uniref:COesterase domain-containing protein n=1 Tax=Caenorhabditis japonica TaxID=281687 RepID=A0A8R1ELM9_CAEJA
NGYHSTFSNELSESNQNFNTQQANNQYQASKRINSTRMLLSIMVNSIKPNQTMLTINSTINLLNKCSESNQNQNFNSQQANNQYQNNGYNTNTTSSQYNGGYLRDQPISMQNSNGITDFSQLRKISQISSDQSTSLTTTQIQSYMLNGDRHVRIYQFTHVSEVGRNTVPDTGANWKPVFKGQDMYFITMSETIWSNSSYTAQDRQVADQMGQRWSDFVKTGQVANWDTTSQQNYNYCNLNTQATQQAQYGQQARQVFQDQVNPICQVGSS